MSTVLETADEASATLDQTAFNLLIWKRLQADPALSALDYRIETDAHGQIIMSPPPAPSHGSKQCEIAGLLRDWNPGGKVLTECPISTAMGVKAADVAWCSQEVWQQTETEACFVRCPEICVEVLSPSNSRSEIMEKRRLYFAAGAREVWLCATDGSMQFFLAEARDTALASSILCASFPRVVG